MGVVFAAFCNKNVMRLFDMNYKIVILTGMTQVTTSANSAGFQWCPACMHIHTYIHTYKHGCITNIATKLYFQAKKQTTHYQNDQMFKQ